MNQTITLDKIASKVNILQRGTIKSIFQEIIDSLCEGEFLQINDCSYYATDYVRSVEIDIQVNEILFEFNIDHSSALAFVFNDKFGVKLIPSDYYVYDGLVYDLSETIERVLVTEAAFIKEITNNLLTYVKGVL